MRQIYINLDSRPDRRAEAEAEFARVDLTVERFAACTGDNRPLAFNKSIRGCMELCRTAKRNADDFDLSVHYDYEDLLLFEDDVVFDCMYVPNFIPPHDHLSCHLGANIIGMSTTIWDMPTQSTTSFAKLHNCWMSHATYYSAECVKLILNTFPYHTDQYEREGCQIWDEWFRTNILPLGRSYVLRPMVAYQRPSISNIWGDKFNDYTGCHKQGNEWMKNNL